MGHDEEGSYKVHHLAAPVSSGVVDTLIYAPYLDNIPAPAIPAFLLRELRRGGQCEDVKTGDDDEFHAADSYPPYLRT